MPTIVASLPVTLSEFTRDASGKVSRTALEAKAEAVKGARAAGVSIRAFCRAFGINAGQTVDRRGNVTMAAMELLALWHVTCGISPVDAAKIAATARVDSRTGLFLNWSPFSALNAQLVGGGELDDQAVAQVNAELAKIAK